MIGREEFFAQDYETPVSFYIDLDTSENPDETFKKLIKILI
jgi:hypothetical protein